MDAHFERQKNIKAAAITGGVAGALFLLFILIRWDLPTITPPVTEEIIDINLGSGDAGFGSNQPQLPGEPAAAAQTAYTPPQPVHATATHVKDVETDDRPENDAPVLHKPANAKPDATEIDKPSKTVNSKPTSEPVATQAPPQPKAVLGRTVGGNGNGGNGADRYEKGGNEGIAGGTGDQGRPGGDPNGRAYSGTPRNFGVKVFNIPAQSFEDDFNENAKIAMDIVTDGNGKVISATFQPRGSTTSNRQMIDIARRRAFELKNISTGDGPAKGTVIFNFKVKS
ncbi:MAG: hypothetical protein ICV84_22405 [Flavisolibacter sp.]|nr:hypothetical protein [Flavisolibacter sp.]